MKAARKSSFSSSIEDDASLVAEKVANGLQMRVRLVMAWRRVM